MLKSDQQPPNVYDQLQRNAAESSIELKHAAAIGAVAALGILGSAATSGNIGIAGAAPAPKVTATEQTDTSGPKTEQGIYLSSVEELPGYRMKASKKERKLLADSTVTILRREKTPEGTENSNEWMDVCTGNVRKFPGYESKSPAEFIVTTAAHCDSSVGSRSGVNYNYTQPEAVDTLPASAYEFAIGDPREYPSLRTKEPIGFVEGMSVSQWGVDSAFMRVRPNDERQPGSRSRLLKDIKGLVYKPAQDPKVGQQVALTSVPYAAGTDIGSHNHIGSTVGRYLGASYMYGRRVAIVGIKPPKATNDKCNFSASGSSAKLADGTTLDALSIRINSGYKDGTVQYDDIYYYDPDSGETKSYNPGMSRIRIERVLGVDTERFSTICGFTMQGAKSAKAMLTGFQYQLPKRLIQVPAEPVPEVPQETK